MGFDELKTKMEEMGFEFEWCDEDVEGTEEDEYTGKEREVTVHAKGWWMKPPVDYNYPRIFVPMNSPHPEAYLNVMLERYEKRYDGEKQEIEMMRHFEEKYRELGKEE